MFFLKGLQACFVLGFDLLARFDFDGHFRVADDGIHLNAGIGVPVG